MAKQRAGKRLPVVLTRQELDDMRAEIPRRSATGRPRPRYVGREMARSPDPLAPPQAPAPSRPESTAIVDALVAAALELGPDASVNAIAERAGVGVASLYRYFPSKASILAKHPAERYATALEMAAAIEAAATALR